MIGPEWVAQQKKLVASRIRNCGERSASPIDISPCPAPPPAGAAKACASAGGRRTRSDTGIMMAPTTSATICIAVRQSWLETSQAASGAIVIGATPMPADTSDTAKLRWVSNQPVTVAIIGAKIVAQEAPTKRPKTNGNCGGRQKRVIIYPGEFYAATPKMSKTTPCTVAGCCEINDLPGIAPASARFDSSGKTPAICHHPANLDRIIPKRLPFRARL